MEFLHLLLYVEVHQHIVVSRYWRCLSFDETVLDLWLLRLSRTELRPGLLDHFLLDILYAESINLARLHRNLLLWASLLTLFLFFVLTVAQLLVEVDRLRRLIALLEHPTLINCQSKELGSSVVALRNEFKRGRALLGLDLSDARDVQVGVLVVSMSWRYQLGNSSLSLIDISLLLSFHSGRWLMLIGFHNDFHLPCTTQMGNRLSLLFERLLDNVGRSDYPFELRIVVPIITSIGTGVRQELRSQAGSGVRAVRPECDRTCQHI